MSTQTLPLARPDGAERRPRAQHLQLVPGRPSRWVIWRRRATAVLALVGLAFLLTVAIGRVGAQAELADKVAGHVVVEPGQSLWDVAVATAADGVDPRQQLTAIEQLNGVGAGDVDAWTVLLLPAR